MIPTTSACGRKVAPLISICISTYNQKSYIRQCIESVLNQSTQFSWELLVGDDCSVDGTSDEISRILAGHPTAFHIRHEQRKGASANIQALFALARGSYIAHLDGDDYWFPNKLERQVRYLEENPQCVAVYTNAFVIDQYGSIQAIFNDAGNRLIDLASLLSRGNFLNNSSMMIRSNRASEIISISHPFIDFEAHLIHARSGLLGHIADPLVAYRSNAQGSLLSNSNERVRELYFKAIASVSSEDATDLTRTQAFADFMRRVLFRAIRSRNPSIFIYWWKRALPESPKGSAYLLLLTIHGFIREILRIASSKLRRDKYPVIYRS